jgi:hypothetical protein
MLGLAATFLLPVAVLLLSLASLPLGAQDTEPAAQPETTAPAGVQDDVLTGPGRSYEAGEYVGPATCASGNCHGSAEATDAYDVLQSEFTIWFHQDAHRTAWEVLLNDESKLIARNMGLDAPAHRATVCLECHATLVSPSRQANPLEREDGISCETCHGPAGGWLARHNEDAFAYEDALAAGMRDLRDLEVRAELCLSCHLGLGGQQVDHELIASGHPELIFELDNYSEAMPSHWVPYEQLGNPEGRRETHGIVAWAVGQVEGFQQGLELLASRAAEGRWPEFAEMSCDSCHHDLAGGEWRQVRGYKYRPGVPPWSPARWVVLRHLIERVDSSARQALDAEVAEVARTVSDVWIPAPQVKSVADTAAKRLSRLVPAVERAGWSTAEARSLLRAIATDREAVLASDRQTAEQIALAAQSLVAHLSGTPGAAGRTRAVGELFATLDDPYAYDASTFLAALDALAGRI